MKFKICYLITLMLCFSSCNKKKQTFAPFKLNSFREEKLSNFSFVAMGCPWQVYYLPGKATILHEQLKKNLVTEVAKYSETFSDWSSESELKLLEKKGYSKELCSSSLFLEALIHAKDLYQLTDGVFDISLGEGDFPSLKIDKKKKCFLFTKAKPKKLTFNGFVKGMVLANLAKIFFRSGIQNFYINAGNGNLAYKIAKDKKNFFSLPFLAFPDGYDFLYFLSQSRTLQKRASKEQQHIFDPKAKTKILEQDMRVICRADVNNDSKWKILASQADAFSTALTIKETLNLPQACKKL